MLGVKALTRKDRRLHSHPSGDRITTKGVSGPSEGGWRVARRHRRVPCTRRCDRATCHPRRSRGPVRPFVASPQPLCVLVSWWLKHVSTEPPWCPGFNASALTSASICVICGFPLSSAPCDVPAFPASLRLIRVGGDFASAFLCGLCVFAVQNKLPSLFTPILVNPPRGLCDSEGRLPYSGCIGGADGTNGDRLWDRDGSDHPR